MSYHVENIFLVSFSHCYCWQRQKTTQEKEKGECDTRQVCILYSITKKIIICIVITYDCGQNCWDDQPFPPPPEFNVEILSYRSGEVTQLCAGGGGGIISSSCMISSVWDWSTEFVVRQKFMTVDCEEAFQLILTRIVVTIKATCWLVKNRGLSEYDLSL